MGLRMKTFGIIGVHWKIWFLEGFTKKQYIGGGGGGLPKKRGGLEQFGLRGVWWKRGGTVFEGWLTPQCTFFVKTY